MKNNFTSEIIISLLLVSLLVFFIDPLDLLMPQSLSPFMVPFLIILFILFAGFLWNEKPGDEREQLHKYIASRFAYFAGIAVLIIGIIAQSTNHEVDPFLIIAVSVMLLAKILGSVYGKLKR